MNIMPIEILSPAGSIESLTAAVRSGCDAVYLGGSSFNARRNAQNFDEAALSKAVRYCHINSVKVYFTINISVLEREIDAAVNQALIAARCGVDAFIVADLGLASILRQRIKNVSLHGSTQMSVHSPAALPLLKKLGFSRIVVAREMSFNNLRDFCKAAKEHDIEVEVFVHGALCMCLSGQCYLSAMLGSRSGNRGLCAGPCRLPFKCENGSGYDLSLKDLSLFEHINELKQLGVASLKIEGRMKRPEYVAAVTAAAKSAVEHGFVPDELNKLLKNVFSRSGFTNGYFADKTDKAMFGIRTKEDVALTAAALNQLHSLYRTERQKVQISAKLSIKKGVPVALTFSDGKNTCTEHASAPDIAKTKATDRDFAFRQISKLGGTAYILDEFSCDIDPDLSVAASTLNDLRRRCADKLNDMRASVKPLDSGENITDAITLPKSTEHKSTPILSGMLARFDNADLVPKKLHGLSGIILPLGEDFKALDHLNTNIYLEMPRGCDDDSSASRLLKEAAPYIKGAFCSTLSSVWLCLKLGIPVIGGFGLNVYNSYTADVLKSLGLNGFTASFENKIEDISGISSGLSKGLITYGRLPLMIFKNCPVKANVGCAKCGRNSSICDRLNESFPLLCRFGYTELYNSRPLWLADKPDLFEKADFTILYFTTESKAQNQHVINAYFSHLKPSGKYTRGLYFKGVL